MVEKDLVRKWRSALSSDRNLKCNDFELDHERLKGLFELYYEEKAEKDRRKKEKKRNSPLSWPLTKIPRHRFFKWPTWALWKTSLSLCRSWQRRSRRARSSSQMQCNTSKLNFNTSRKGVPPAACLFSKPGFQGQAKYNFFFMQLWG